jgi:hypothetical protein
LTLYDETPNHITIWQLVTIRQLFIKIKI